MIAQVWIMIWNSVTCDTVVAVAEEFTIQLALKLQF
jgi:hypothetical protein